MLILPVQYTFVANDIGTKMSIQWEYANVWAVFVALVYWTIAP